ncbi:MAG: DUF433 domain-containing protein [Bryobacteraceae bacterium]|nr:DUF433 domain-containing protein [Bryobacteraceae bacterium]
MNKEYVERREGGYYVSGTRVSLDSLIHAFRRGESPETIRQNFEVLRLEEVYGAIAYYLANQASMDAYLVSQGQKWTDGKRAAGRMEPRPGPTFAPQAAKFLPRPGCPEIPWHPRRVAPWRRTPLYC